MLFGELNYLTPGVQQHIFNSHDAGGPEDDQDRLQRVSLVIYCKHIKQEPVLTLSLLLYFNITQWDAKHEI